MANKCDTKSFQVVSAALIGLLGLIVICSSKADAFDVVDTGVSQLSPDGKHVGVNIPGIFNMILDTRGPQKGLRMTQTIMMGLVRVDMDRVNGTDGVMRGPMRVSVAGITVYNNRQPPVSTGQKDANSPPMESAA